MYKKFIGLSISVFAASNIVAMEWQGANTNKVSLPTIYSDVQGKNRLACQAITSHILGSTLAAQIKEGSGIKLNQTPEAIQALGLHTNFNNTIRNGLAIKKMTMSDGLHLVICDASVLDENISFSNVQSILSKTSENYTASFNKTGDQIGYSIAGQYAIIIVDKTADNVLATIPVNDENYIRLIKAIAFNNDSSRIAVVSTIATQRHINILTIFNIATGSPYYSVKLPDNLQVKDISFSQDDNLLHVKNIDNDFIIDLTACNKLENYLVYELNEKQIQVVETMQKNFENPWFEGKPIVGLSFEDIKVFNTLKPEIKELFNVMDIDIMMTNN